MSYDSLRRITSWPYFTSNTMQIISVLTQSLWVFLLLTTHLLLFDLCLISVELCQVGLHPVSHTFTTLGLRVTEDFSQAGSRWDTLLVANYLNISDFPQNFLNQDSFAANLRFSFMLFVAVYYSFLDNFSRLKRCIMNRNSLLIVRANNRSCHPTFLGC